MARLLFNTDRHEYFAAGRKLVSVTQVIERAGLGVDYSMVPDDILQHAAERGRHVHAACEYVDQADLDRTSLAPEILPYVEAYWQFCNDTGFEPVETERKLHCPNRGYAGTPDVWGWIGDERVEVDRKATAVLSIPAVSLQMAGYAPLIRTHDPEWRAAKRYGLQLRKDGSYRFREANTPYADETFAAALAVVTGGGTDNDAAWLQRWREAYGNQHSDCAES